MNEINQSLASFASQGAMLIADSRAVQKGDVFVALKGASFDGHDYVDSAIANGAAAVLLEKEITTKTKQVSFFQVAGLSKEIGKIANDYYGKLSEKAKIIAITGTKGKTTTSIWCSQLLETAGLKAGFIGTLGSARAKELKNVKHTSLTTPGVVELHTQLANLVNQGSKAIAIEASSHALAQSRLAGVDCDVAVFTNLGHDHLDYHQDLDDYLKAKLKLFQREELDCVVVNADDPHALKIIESCDCQVIKCGTTTDCDLIWQATDKKVAKISYDDNSLDFVMPMPGKHNVLNVALAVGATLGVGLKFEDLKACLDCLEILPGRMQSVSNNDVTAYVDFAHTAEALEATLVAIQETHPQAKITCVFGCGGDRDKAKRPLMGEVATRIANEVIITSDNYRNEDPKDIAEEIKAGASGNSKIIINRSKAIEEALQGLQKGDVMLVAGKGDETKIIGQKGTFLAFSDIEKVKELIVS